MQAYSVSLLEVALWDAAALGLVAPPVLVILA